MQGRVLTSLAVTAVLLGAFAPSARAQRDVDIERFEPALDQRGFLGVQGTRTPGPGRASYGLLLNYGSKLLAVDSRTGETFDLVDDRLGGTLSVELGLGQRAALGFAAPFVAYQTGDALDDDQPEVQAFALRDQRLSARYRFIGDVPKDALSNDDGPGLALMVTGVLPGGDPDRYSGEDAFRLDAQLLADMHLLGFGMGASVGWRHRFEERELFGARVRDELTFGGAFRIPLPPLHPVQVLLEVRGATDFESAATTAVEGQLGVMLPLENVTLTMAAGPGLTGGIGVPDVRVVAGLWYAPSERDADHDGVADEQDQCPPLPEDKDGFQDLDGCPDPDNDNDMILDRDDLCPNVEALEDRDLNEDGCTDE